MTAVILDFDGTLFALETDYAGMRAALAAALPQAGIDRPGALTKFLAGAGAAERATVLGIVARYEAAGVAAGAFFDDALPFLAALRARSVPHGILTRNCRGTVAAAFGGAGLAVPEVVALDDDVAPKPDPASARRLLAALGAPAAPAGTVLVVGDSEYDVAVADRIGARCVLRANPRLPRPPSAGGRVLVGSLADLDLEELLSP